MTKTMRNINSLAFLTFKGAMRERTFHVVVLLGLILFLVTPSLTAIVPRQGIQVALDFVMSIVSFVGLVLAVFLGSNLITKDVDKKTIYSIISQPMSRQQYVLGRFLGMALVLAGALMLMTVFGLLSFYITIKFFNDLGDSPSWFLFGMNLGFNLEMLLLLVAASFLVSAVSSNSFLTLSVTIGFYYAGQSLAQVKALLESATGREGNVLFKAVVKAAYYIFPNLGLFNLKARAAYNLGVPAKELVIIFFYGVIYTAVLLIVNIVIFRKRDIA